MIFRLTNSNWEISELRIFDNSSQAAKSVPCTTHACPGLMLSTPDKCVCTCGNGMTLNAIGTICMPQPNYVQSDCPAGKCGRFCFNRIFYKIQSFNLSGQFQCKQSKQCIEELYLCDGDHDCSDGSDEAYIGRGPCNAVASNNCEHISGGMANAIFRCDGSRCLRRSVVCDGTPNCNDGSDEAQNCTAIECESDQFQCVSTKQCIPKSWVCDHNHDCADLSDELNCDDCADFTCANKVCIPHEQMCNGEDNCG